jgi:hypothetical protein
MADGVAVLDAFGCRTCRELKDAEIRKVSGRYVPHNHLPLLILDLIKNPEKLHAGD